jgi:putative oxygen-independent coproporphyrinogen III oxidase
MLPLSLYVHIPWCIKKCHYCDFNSHANQNKLPEDDYLSALIKDLQQDITAFGRPKLKTIFIGGGTPSLCSANFYNRLFTEISKICILDDNIEITLEANPGTVEHGLFSEYLAVGINRLSLGIQSFNDEILHKLGRVHDSRQAKQSIESAKKSGFTNINLDIMYSLPGQSIHQSLNDLKEALAFSPQHLSWYQLTIEPNTLFYKTKPRLPADDITVKIEQQGLELLKNHGLSRYEISAFCKDGYESQHNLNYWLFGDYLGIGAGAHGKYTNLETKKILRTNKFRQPNDYMYKNFLVEMREIITEDLIFEFMLNTTRLEQKIPHDLFTTRTLLPYNFIDRKLGKAEKLGLITLTNDYWQITPFGRRFTNNLQEIFLP